MQYHEIGTYKEDFQKQAVDFLEHVYIALEVFSVVDGFIFLCMEAGVKANLK